jgi:hypothetical protein
MVKIRNTFANPKKMNFKNNYWKAKIKNEQYDDSPLKTQKIIGIKEYLEGPVLEI